MKAKERERLKEGKREGRIGGWIDERIDDQRERGDKWGEKE